MPTHNELAERAKHWLSGTMRCNPVFSNLASCTEVPDAIGWTSKYKFHGSIVVECKTSHSDFLADKKKAVGYQHPEHQWNYYSGRRIARKVALREGYIEKRVPRMGDFRYFLCTGMISIESIKKHAPDHGLLYWEGRRIHVVLEAPRRHQNDIDYQAEIRYLRFAIINCKQAYGIPRPSALVVGTADSDSAHTGEDSEHA
jgi:hypothetical protein